MKTKRLVRLAAILGAVSTLILLMGGMSSHSSVAAALPQPLSSAQPAPALAATTVPSISNIVGATFEPTRGEMIVFGIADPALPMLDPAYIRDNLIVALRAFYDPHQIEVPGVSIEGTIDPLRVEYFGNVTNTHYGRVSFESDRLLKTYTLGRDNVMGLTVTSAVTGYASYPARMQQLTETVTEPILIRYFFTPTLIVVPITSPQTIIFSQTDKLIDWAYMGTATSTATTQAAQDWVDNFNQRYWDYAAERWAVYGDATLYEMAQLSKLTAIAQWAQEQGWDQHIAGLNAPWLEHYPLPFTTTVTQTAGITVTWVQTIARQPYQSIQRGGVYGIGSFIRRLATAVEQALAQDVQKQSQSLSSFGIRDNQCHCLRPQSMEGGYCQTQGPLVGYAVSIADNALSNGGFENGPGSGWNENSPYEMIVPGSANSGIYGARLAGYDNAHDSLFQALYIPPDATLARLTYWQAAVTDETSHPWDWFAAFLSDVNGNRLVTLETLSDADADGYWNQKSFDVTPFKGQTVQLWFTATTNGLNSTSFYLDDISLDYLDLTPPGVVATIHTPQIVPLGTPVEFTLNFRERMKTSTVPVVTIHAQETRTGYRLQSSADYAPSAPTSYTLTPKSGAGYTQGYLDDDLTQWYGVYTFTSQMQEGLYVMDVAKAQDLAGNVMYPATGVYTASFNAIPPQVLSQSPANGASNVAASADIVITFSEAISASTFSYTVVPDPGGWIPKWDGTKQLVTLSHNPFASGTVYTVTVTQAQDLAGNSLNGAPVTWSFATADTVSPQIQTTSPSNGASDISIGANIVVTFSEPISASTFIYTTSPDPGGWSANWDSAQKVVSLSHGPFAPGTTYTVAANQAQDLAGNPLAGAPVTWSFTTVLVDTTPPQIQSVAPSNGASNIPIGANIVVTFSEPISISTFNYTVTPNPGGWSASWDNTKQAVTLSHTPFAMGMPYTITVNQAQDLAGNPLTGTPVTWTFTTIVIDATPPQIQGLFPSNGANAIPIEANIVITFSEAISASTLDYSVSPSSIGWLAQWDNTQQVVNLSHNPFAMGTAYTVTLNQARDLAGNSLTGAPMTWSFTTLAVDTLAPQVQNTFPAHRANGIVVDASLVITFSEPISASTFSYTIAPNVGGESAHWDNTQQVVTLSHNLFAMGTVYTVTIIQAQDLAGNPLTNAPVTWVFTTAVSDGLPPQILGVLPSDGAVRISLQAAIVITFSEAISPSTLVCASRPDPGGWGAIWNISKNTVSLIHHAFVPGTLYTITVSQAQDLGGNPLSGAPVTWSFVTWYQVYLPAILKF